MSKGRQKHQDYLGALSLLGKDLARRAKSKCELSEEAGTLVTYDLEGPDSAPSMEHVLLVSPVVQGYLDGGKFEAESLRYLENVVWSTEPAIRHAAIRLLERIEAPWAHDAIDNARSMEG
jgi:protein PhnA